MQNRIIYRLCLFALFTVALILSLGLFSNPAYSAESANYRIDTDVLSGGGRDCDSLNYFTISTMGQPTAIGESSSANYMNYAGFWYTLPQPREGCYWLGDINCDEKVDISDVILVLRITLQLDSVKPCSDINGEGEVDISDVILTLRMTLGLDEWRPC